MQPGTSTTAVSSLTGTNTAPTFKVGSGTLYPYGALVSGGGLALQADNKILAAGSINGNFMVSRLNADGSLDATFDGDGIVTTDLGATDVAYSVAVQADQKLVVAGESGGQFWMTRYKADGSLDSSFGSAGKIVANFVPAKFDHSIVALADGKIVACGSQSGNFVIARFTAEGTADTTFGVNGLVTTDFGNQDLAQSLAVKSDGSISVAGLMGTSSSNYLAPGTLGADGALKFTGYNNSGVQTLNGANASTLQAREFGLSVTVQSDGKIVVAGYKEVSSTNADFLLMRFNTDGTLDTSFDGDGVVTTDFGSIDLGRSVALQADGKIVATGTSNDPPAGGFPALHVSIARYNSNGSLDTSFDNDGKLTLGSSIGQVLVQPDGKFLVSGSGSLTRYNTDGSLDVTFNGGGNTIPSAASYGGLLSATARLAPIAQVFDAELSASNSYNGSTLTLARRGGASSDDAFATYSSVLSTLTSGATFAVDGITVGQVVSNASGSLQLAFNTSATQALVSRAMQQITYYNTAKVPPATVQIDWTFSDGNTGAQGNGAALQATGSTKVTIYDRNAPPVLAKPLADVSASAFVPMSLMLPSDAFTDANANEPFSFSATAAGGAVLPSWLSFNPATLTFSGTPSNQNIGSVDVNVTARDVGGLTAFDVFRITVTPSLDTTPPTVLSFNPSDEATGVAIASNIVVNFSEAVQKGSGTIVLKTAANAVVESFDAAASTRLSITGTALTLDPTLDLAFGTEFKLELAQGTVKDLPGNLYAGTTSYNFTSAMDPANQTLTGTAANEAFIGGAGNDTIDGGDGIDTSVYSGSRSAYTISVGVNSSASTTVQDLRTALPTDGVDSLRHVERLQFADTRVAIDLNGYAGQAAKLLGVVFGPSAVANKQYVGVALSLLDGGMTYEQLAVAALGAVGKTNATDVVALLWTNLFGSAPTTSQVEPLSKLLEDGVISNGSFAVLAADLNLNTERINLVGLAHTGLEYV